MKHFSDVFKNHIGDKMYSLVAPEKINRNTHIEGPLRLNWEL